MRKVAAELVPDLLDRSIFDTESTSDEDLQERANKAHSRVDEIRKSVELIASQADKVVAEWRTSKDESSWKTSVDAAKRAYNELTENLSREGAGDPAAYGELVQRRQVIEQRIEELDEREKTGKGLNDQADEHLQVLLKLRRDFTASRRRFLKAVLDENPYVQIQVDPYGAHETVEGELRRLLQREDGTFEKDIGSPEVGGLLGELYGPDDDAELIEKNLAYLKNRVKEIASNEPGVGSVADRRFATHVSNLPPEAIDRIELWFPEDSLAVQYSARGDGQGFKSIEEGSPGQKTAALLAFLLSYGDEPLILDQPEDDLDNHLIYDLIVTQFEGDQTSETGHRRHAQRKHRCQRGRRIASSTRSTSRSNANRVRRQPAGATGQRYYLRGDGGRTQGF